MSMSPLGVKWNPTQPQEHRFWVPLEEMSSLRMWCGWEIGCVGAGLGCGGSLPFSPYGRSSLAMMYSS